PSSPPFPYTTLFRSLLRRVIRYATSAMGRVPTQWDYSDYRPVAGVMMPFKFTYGWISGREEYTLTEIQPNVPIDAGKFDKPVPRDRKSTRLNSSHEW